MASESPRGCGYRKVGGTYLVGGYVFTPCDRLPYPLDICPTCSGGIKVTRGFTKINPRILFANHEYCTDRKRPCWMCDPKDEVAFIIGVGQKFYTPDRFMWEAQEMGVSKRIPFVPKALKVGETVVYLSHPKACTTFEPPTEENNGDCSKSSPGIFCVFIPQKIEKLCWQSQHTPENIEKHRKRGIELVPVPDGDVDHA